MRKGHVRKGKGEGRFAPRLGHTHLAAWGHVERVGRESLTRGGMMRNIRHKVYVERAEHADARKV